VRRLVPLIALAFAAAACGGGATATETAVVATQTVVDTVTVEPLPTITTITLSSPTFQMPSKNIGCTLGEGVLVCDVLSGLNPEPKKSCELDWTGMEMESNGPAQPRCAGDTAYVQSAPVLAYGDTWGSGGFFCTSATTGLKCFNRDEHGFSLSREAWAQF
jgi:Family of unknown function (DUF6636)